MADSGGEIIRTAIALDTSQTVLGANDAIAAIRGIGAATAQVQQQVTGGTGALADQYSALAIQSRAAAQGLQLTAVQAEIMAQRITTIKQAYGQAFGGIGLPTGGMSSAATASMGQLQAMAQEMDKVRAATMGAVPAVQQGASFLTMLGGNAGKAAVGVSYLRRELVSSAATMTGTNPMLDRLVYTLTALSGPGMGEVAIGMIAMVAGLGLAAKAWKMLNADVTAAQKTLGAFNKTNAEMLAQSKVIAQFKLAGGSGVADDFAASSAAIAKPQADVAAAQTLADNFASGHAGDPVAAITQIATALVSGTGDATNFAAQLQRIAEMNRGTGYAQQALDVAKYATAIATATDQLRTLEAEQQHQQAIQAENVAKYGGGPIGFLGSGPADAARKLAAAQSGGQAAVDRLNEHTHAVKLATGAWNKWTVSVQGAWAAGMTFDHALAQHLPLAESLLATTERQVAADKGAADAVRAQNAAQKAQDAATRKTIDHGLKLIDAYDKGQRAQTRFAASITANLATLGAENADLKREIAVVGQSQEARDAVTISIAGETAVRRLRTEAVVKGIPVDQVKIDQLRQEAEAHERLTLTLQGGRQAAAGAGGLDRQINAEKMKIAALTMSHAALVRYNADLIFQNELSKHSGTLTKEQTNNLRAQAFALAQLDTQYTEDVALINAQKAAARQAEQAAKQTARDIANALSSTVSGFFDNLLTKGTNIWASLMQTLERGFVSLIARLAAQDLVKKILVGATAGGMALASVAGAQVPTGVAGISVPLMHTGASAQTAGIGAALAGLGVGYGVGSQTTNAGLGALGGAASGAAAGAMLGSVVPGIGTAIGAVVGAVAGLVGGLLGSADKAKKAAEQMARARTSFETTWTGLVAAFHHDSLGLSIARVTQQFDRLRTQAQSAYQGADLAYELTQINTLQAGYIQQLNDQYAAQQALLTQSLQVRQLQADLVGVTGEQAVALKNQIATAQLAAKQEQELATARQNGTSAANLVLLQGTLALETVALQRQQQLAAAAVAFAGQQAAGQLQARLLAAQGDTEAASALTRHLAQVKEWNDAVTQGQTAAYLGQLAITHAAETAKAVADTAAQAQQQALTQLQQQFTVFGTTSAVQLATIAQLYGFTGMTLAQVQALYTSYTAGGTLTAQQTQGNAAVAEYIRAYTTANGPLNPAKAAVAASNISRSVTSLTSGQFDLGLGLWNTMNAHLFNIDQQTRTMAGGAGGFTFAAPARAPGGVAAVGGGDTFVIQVTVDGGAGLTPGQQVGVQIDQLIARRQTSLRAAAGVPRGTA